MVEGKMVGSMAVVVHSKVEDRLACSILADSNRRDYSSSLST
jgi:hypothetical protein